ncbi:protein DpdH [Sorangium sp. So ce291]|uniref:protein DpdH n=1 Tax=Sorangium sp. So ce291 TaxID=3133294 RepID=UPI003F632618
MSSTNELLRFWPRRDDVISCVKTDAEASSKAVSLAVHQTMHFQRRVIGGQAGSGGECDERELLRAFLEEHLSDGLIIVPIVGSSGVGKSHVIRWLDVQVRSSARADRRVIIRIPKGISLRGVLGLLLDELRSPAYDRYRRELERAQQELDAIEAAGLLCEMLAHTIEEMGEKARLRLLENPTDVEAKTRVTYCARDMLPTLLRNQFLRERHFVRTAAGDDGVVTKLVEQLTVERAAGSDDDRKHSFAPEDLDFRALLDTDMLGRREQQALMRLDRDDRRYQATKILNFALDDAKQRLLRLDPTVSDLFDAVRRDLLREKKELVLLVEDFAAISGLQKQLLQVVIKEAVQEGRQQLCTMRTALAYTTGYMDTDTVLTRANVEYRILDEPGAEEHIFERIERLVGAYLNAARLGQRAIEQAYDGRQSGTGDPHEWIPRFSANVEPETRATVDAFGSSPDGYELFPLNREAIRQLAREGCVRDGRLVHNPRYVIQNVLNKVLAQRELFERGEFPPASFGAPTTRVSGSVTHEVEHRVGRDQFDRFLRFLAYWGGLPASVAHLARVDRRLVEAFNLDSKALRLERRPPPAPLVGGDRRSQGPPPTYPPPAPPPPSIESPEQRLIAQWDVLLERWRSGSVLSQEYANDLRKWVFTAAVGAVEWNWVQFRPLKVAVSDRRHELIYLPRAGGGEGRTAEDAMAAVCTDQDLVSEASSARVKEAVMAIVRHHGVYKGSWDYDGAEGDLARYGALVAKLAPRVRAFLRERYFRISWDPAPTLVQGLLISARAIGVEGADKDDPVFLLNAIFAPAPDAAEPGNSEPRDTSPTEWEELQAALARCRRPSGDDTRARTTWIHHLLDLVGARQGNGDLVHAVDVLRLRPLLDDALQHWTLAAPLPKSDPTSVPEFPPFKSAYTEIRRLMGAISKEQRALAEWRRRATEWLGPDFDKDELVRTMKETIEAARAAGLAKDVDTKRLLQRVEAFRQAKVKAALDDTGRLDDAASRGVVLAILSRGYGPTTRLCEVLRTEFEAFERSAIADIADGETRYGDDPVAEAACAVRSELETAEQLLRGLSDDVA